MLDRDVRRCVFDFEAWFVRATRLAVTMQGPTGNQHAVADRHVTQVTLIDRLFVVGRWFRSGDQNRAPRDQHAVQCETAGPLAADAEGIGAISHVIQQANDWADAVGRADLQAFSLIQFDAQWLGVHSAVRYFYDGRNRFQSLVPGRGLAEGHFVFRPLVQRSLDAGIVAFRGWTLALRHAVSLRVCRLRQRPLVFPAANVRTESIPVIDDDSLLRELVDGKHKAACLRIHGHVIARRVIVPMAQVCRDDKIGWQRLFSAPFRPIRRPDDQALTRAVVGLPSFCVIQSPFDHHSLLESATSNRRGQVQFLRNVGRVGFALRRIVEWGVGAQHAEGVTVRSFVLAMSLGPADGGLPIARFRAGPTHRVRFQTPHEHSNAGDVETALCAR